MTEKNNINIWDIKNKELLNLIIARDGGKTTIKILDKILKQPYNKNQLSKILKLDYNTITYHLKIICRYDYATEEKFEKNYYYHPSDKLFKSMDEYKLIKEFLKNK